MIHVKICRENSLAPSKVRERGIWKDICFVFFPRSLLSAASLFNISPPPSCRSRPGAIIQILPSLKHNHVFLLAPSGALVFFKFGAMPIYIQNSLSLSFSVAQNRTRQYFCMIYIDNACMHKSLQNSTMFLRYL